MTILDKIKKIIIKETGISLEQDNEKSTLINDLGFDYLEFINLIMLIEKEFSISISEKEAENISTIGDIVNLVK